MNQRRRCKKLQKSRKAKFSSHQDEKHLQEEKDEKDETAPVPRYFTAESAFFLLVCMSRLLERVGVVVSLQGSDDMGA